MSIHQLHPRVASLSWQGRLDLATTEAEVVAIAREFVALCSPYELARLPEACRPRKIIDANDVTSYALALMRHHCDDVGDETRIVHRLAAFFSHASIRLSHILAASLPNENAERRRSA